MAEKVPNRATQKSNVSSVPVKEIHGITYFKLHSDYPGDYTKNCGLLGNEIDENFYFLRSNDIKTGYTEEIENKKYLVLVKVDDEEIRIDITDAYDINFKVEDGYIYAIYPDGREVPFGEDGDPRKPVKFLVEGNDVHIVTDSSINGDGSYGNPIGIDLASKTGTYAPADFFVDFTCGDKSLKDYENIGYSHAIVTKEQASRFGALYTYWQAEKINEALAGSGWRVPSVSDWAKLLNGVEVNEDAKDHDTMMSGNFGCIAGTRLKSIDFWNTEEPASDPTDDFGMCVYPVGVYPDANNAREPKVSGFTGLYEVASFWEFDEANGEGYYRVFSYGHDDVGQFTASKATKRSIRLVKDVEGDFDVPEFTVILGNYIPVVYVPESKQVWTSVNIGFTNYDGYKENQVVVPEEWNEVESFDGGLNLVTEPKFYYNAWDGKEWHKKLMKEGESVVILYEDPEEPCDTASTPYVTSANTNHEWRVFFNGETNEDELVDTLEALKEEFQEILDEINEKIDDLSEATEELSATTASLQEEIATEIERAISAETMLQEEIADEFERAMSAETELHEDIISEIERAMSAETELHDEIEAEAKRATSAETMLQEEIAAEIERAMSAETELHEEIAEEASARTEADEYLQEQIDELKAKTIEPLDDSITIEVSGNTTSIGVAIAPGEEHIKIGDGTEAHSGNTGIYFDADFGEFGE